MSDNLSLSQGLTVSLAAAGLAIGTTKSKIKTANNVTYTIDGRFYTKTATDNIAISYTGPTVYQASSGGVQAVTGNFTGAVGGSSRIYLIGLDASGNVSILPGKIANTTDVTAGRVALEFPDAQIGICPIGALRIDLTASTAFVVGTTLLDATGVTATFIDLADVPANPLTA